MKGNQEERRMAKKAACSKCEAEADSSFTTQHFGTSDGNMILVYCTKCGAVQGVVKASY
jgi:DNA-directed RNA polymerase subunit M/transcription elongation factor TFIIS